MILQALAQYYSRLSDMRAENLAPPGFSVEKVHFALVIDQRGKLLQVADLRGTKGSRLVPRESIVPQPVKKSVNIAANFLWGSTSYVLGADEKGKPERSLQCFEAFRQLHRDLLAKCKDEAAIALLAFLSNWDPPAAPRLDHWQYMLSGNIVFQMDGERGFVHECPAMRQIWADSLADAAKGEMGMCLVSGQVSPIARLHPAIKGVSGAQSSGAAIVSFNLDAFCSYGKSQNFNAPISEEKTFAYTTALNRMLRSGSRNRIQIADATTVFWTERDSPVEGFFGLMLDPRDTSSDEKELAIFLEAIRDGKLPSGIDPEVRFFILGLSPNASRISVRFWHMSTVKDISEKLGQHFRDLAIVRTFENDPEYPGMWQLLRETANRKSSDGPPPLLAGAVMQAILKGTPYPEQLLSAIVGRIRAEQEITYMKAAIIKAVLTRKKRILNQGMEVSMALDKENKNRAYLLGRLFAVLEKAQQDAIPGANTTIKDRFYGSASATPRIVFPQLLRLAQHHIEKAEYGKVRDKQIEGILSDIQEFPAHMGLDEQGMFAIGYYHQRQDFFKKTPTNNDKEN